MATSSTTTVTKTITPSAGMHWSDAALVAATALVPLALTVLGAIPNAATAIAAMVLGAVWTLAKTYLASKHLDKAQLEAQVAVLEAAFEKATGKTIPADIKTAIEFSSGAVAEAAGLTTPPVAP